MVLVIFHIPDPEDFLTFFTRALKKGQKPVPTPNLSITHC